MEQSYNINFFKTAIEYLPTWYRIAFWKAFVMVLISPVDLLYNVLMSERSQNLERLKTTNQKFSIQKRLNDLFDPLERRIVIVKAILFEGVFLYTEAEDDPGRNKTQWLYINGNPLYLYTEAELNSDIDFIVKVPGGINEIRLKAEIEYHMLQSKNYKIEII